jgi:hypothetical protein
VPTAVETIGKSEGPYLRIRRANNNHPKKAAQVTNIMAVDQIRSDRGKWSEIETRPTEAAATTNSKTPISNTIVIAQPPSLAGG